jgi:PBP4 family serine-type D-alanyl-D-alanine carboxypeptidase
VAIFKRSTSVALAIGLFGLQPGIAAAQSDFDAAFKAVVARPEFVHSTFGAEIYSLDRKTVLYSWNPEKLFLAASTTKVVTVASAYNLLGADYRFRTAVYRNGTVQKGVLTGDIILVASGDPNLSGRKRADGTLAYSNEDHSYGGFDAELVGDPVEPLRALAKQIAASGISEVRGRVLVDASLFREGETEPGTGMTISPISLNDNIIDVVIAPGAVGAAATVSISPQVPYIRFTNTLTTGAADASTTIDYSEIQRPDGTIDVTLKGQIPSGKGDYVKAYRVKQPARFAATLFAEALQKAGIRLGNRPAEVVTGIKPDYAPADRVGEYVSAPLSEDGKIILKTSQNLHASMLPYVVGSVRGGASDTANKRGFELAHDYMKAAGLDTSGAVQSYGNGSSMFTPDFMVRYLAYMAGQPNFGVLRDALPVLGRDGTLVKTLTRSAAAGKVLAKTGTSIQPDFLHQGVIVTAKGLVGYTTTTTGERIAIAIYVNDVPLTLGRDDYPAASAAAGKLAGDAMAEIAAAAHLLPIAGAK